MKDQPVLWLLAGPNGAGKSSFYEFHLKRHFPELPFVNADVLARQRWPGDEERHGHEASRLAAEWRQRMLSSRNSFVTETVFSHPSKVELVRAAKAAGYRVILVFVYVEVEVAVARVAYRVAVEGGHAVPERKIRERHARLSRQVAEAMRSVDRTEIFYNGAPGGVGHERIGFVDAGRVQWTRQPPPAWASELVAAAGFS